MKPHCQFYQIKSPVGHEFHNLTAGIFTMRLFLFPICYKSSCTSSIIRFFFFLNWLLTFLSQKDKFEKTNKQKTHNPASENLIL